MKPPELPSADPDPPETLFQRGLAFHQAGRLAEAEDAYRKVLLSRPEHFDALYSLGIIAAQRGRNGEALQLIERALRVEPDHAEAQFNRGNLLHSLKRSEESLPCYDRAIELTPNFAPAYFNRGLVLQTLGRAEEAVESYDRTLDLEPHFADALLQRGDALKDLKRFGEALASYTAFIAQNPGVPKAHNDRGNVLEELNRPAEALAEYDRAIALKPDDAELHYNRGNLLVKVRRMEEAVAGYLRALELKPDFVDARYNLATSWLSMGELERGFSEYECRWERRRTENLTVPQFSAPLWLDQEPLVGKTILLHAEQGLGDTLQFCRYARLVNDLGGRVILRVQKPLLGLLQSLEGVAETVADGDALPAFDFHCPLMSLPHAFGTRLDTVPAPARYISADPARVAAWRERLGPKTKPRVGLAWSGDPRNTQRLNRSMSLSAIEPLLVDGIEWFSLHRRVPATDAQVLSARADLHHYGEEMDFPETAALAELMDLVISVDTSIAHLAGAMGKAVWLLLAYQADWRWMLEREDTPWYPSATLFRQENRGDWSALVQDVKPALSAWLDRLQSEA